jgi:hypothetical protein
VNVETPSSTGQNQREHQPYKVLQLVHLPSGLSLPEIEAQEPVSHNRSVAAAMGRST